jgi:predicted transcriptional regulator
MALTLQVASWALRGWTENTLDVKHHHSKDRRSDEKNIYFHGENTAAAITISEMYHYRFVTA